MRKSIVAVLLAMALLIVSALPSFAAYTRGLSINMLTIKGETVYIGALTAGGVQRYFSFPKTEKEKLAILLTAVAQGQKVAIEEAGGGIDGIMLDMR